VGIVAGLNGKPKGIKHARFFPRNGSISSAKDAKM
jgi:hypothetical protein